MNPTDPASDVPTRLLPDTPVEDVPVDEPTILPIERPAVPMPDPQTAAADADRVI